MFRLHQKVAYLGCEFEYIQAINSHQALIRNKNVLRKEDLIVSVSKLSVFKEVHKGFRYGS